MAPELRYGALLLFVIARVEPHGPSTQGVDQQAIAAAGTRREEDVPRPTIAVEAGAAQIPIERVEAVEVSVPGEVRFGLVAVEREGAFEVMPEALEGQDHPGQLHPAKVVEEGDAALSGG
jgi:hypothetical protein